MAVSFPGLEGIVWHSDWMKNSRFRKLTIPPDGITAMDRFHLMSVYAAVAEDRALLPAPAASECRRPR